MFDSATIVWYAVICGSLAAFAPQFGGRLARMVIGALVGVLAAFILPFAKGLLGY